MKAKQDCHHVEVHSIRPLQGGKQCQVKDDCNQTLPLMKCGCQDEQGQSLEVLKLPSSISIRDFGLSLSESDQAETDFSKLCDEFSDTPQLENMPFIDDNGDVKSIDPIIPTAKYSMVEPFKIKTNSMTTDDPGHMACDSTDQYLNRCSPHPDSDYVIVTAKASYKSDTNTAFSSLLIPIAHCASQLPEENATLPFIEYIPFTPDSLLSEHHCGSPPVNESGLSENWTLNDPILRLSSPESVMSISDYRAMSPDSPQGEKRILPDFSCILDDSRALSPRSDACSSPEITIDFTENKLHPNQSHTHKFETQLESLKDYATTVNSHSLCSDSFESWNKYRPLCPSSQVPTFCSTIPDGPQIKGGIGALSPVTSNIECDDFLQYVYLDRSSSDSARNIDGYGSLDRDCQPSSPESQTSQCSFSFLELLLSEPIRAELMSQFCDYYLLYSGEDPPYPMLTSAPSMTGCNEKVGEGRAFTPNLLASHLDPPLPEKSVTSSSYIPPDMSVSQDIHMNCDYLQYSVDAPLKSVRGIYRGDCSGKTVKSLQVKPLSLETPQLQEKSSQSFIDYWFSKLEPEPSQFTTSEGQSDIHLTNNGQTTPQHNEVQCFDHKIHKQLTETCQMFKELTLPKPVVFNLVERPKYNFEFQGEKLHTDDSLLERGKRALKPHMSNILLGKMDDDLSLDNSDESRQDSNKSTFMSDISQSSPISLATVEQHFFSNIMTFGHMKSQHCNYYLQCSECKPLSPLPTLSDVEHYACLDEFIKENRPDSLGSQPSQIEANHTGVSVTAALQGSTVNALTYADVLHGVTYEKHAAAIPAVSAFKLGPLWPLSLTSDEEYTHSTTDDWISELRPQSPKSLASQWELRSLSPDSPVPQFRTPHVDYDLDLARDRSFTPESTFSDWEGTDFCLDTLFDESRPQSPESVSSEYELGSLSPDSPVPQFRCPCTCDDVELTRNRSFTPESTLSDWEGTDLCLDALFDESRPESPQSVLSDLGLDRFFSNRTLSPESVSSDFDFSLLHDWLADFRASSPESVASVEQHPFSSSMAFGQMMTQHCDYYLQHSECRPVSPLSTLSDVEYYDFCLEELFDENRPDSPDSLTSQIEAKHTSVSATASLRLSNVKALAYADIVRGITHEKHTSVVPAVSAFEMKHLWPLSMTSDEEYTHSDVYDWVSELRPQSPESLASQWELRPLSPDSPVPQFRTPHVDYDLDLARDRSFTPESTFSDWEGTDFCLDTLFNESRPQSPESVSSEYELRSLSPDSPVPQFRCPRMCDDVELTKDRSCTPESTLSDWEGTDLCLDFLFDESRTESPQSVLSDLGLDRFFGNRALSPESVSSDFDFSLLHEWLADFRASSPQSVASVEQHPFSSSMAFGQMMTQHCDYYLQHSECRPVSPLSTLSDVEYHEFYLEELFDENRPDSPDSLTSQIEAKYTSVSATTSLPLTTSKPLTYADIVRGVTHMEHEDKMPIVSSFELRPFWFSSMTSDEGYSLSTIDDWVSELRPQSPESLASQWELRSLSPDSPVPHFRTPHVGYDLDLARDRSFTPESTFSDWEGTDFCLDTLFDESRPQSPESVSSEYELGSLSPDSPVPQFRCPCTCDDVELTRNRSFTPESTLSDWEGTDLCLDALFDESRPESPQSVLSDLGLDRFFSNRTLSPESVSSDFDFSLLHDWLADFRASSPESVASVEQHPFSSSMAFGQMMTQHCDYYLQHSECRPVSPLSTLSDVEYYDFCLEELFDENRPDSPDSLTSQNEAKHTSVSATASLLFATSKPLTYADIVRGVTHMGHEDKMPTVSSFELRPFWLSSMTSDEEYNLSTIDDWVSDLRPQSPESLASQWELRSLSPDSPVPQFRTPHVDYDLDLARDRSFTPESTLSDWEGTDLCLDALFDESRPESPQSVLSDLGLDRFFSNRTLSPESVSSDFDFSLLHDWLADFRASSPESVASVEQHPFSSSMAFGQMMTQHCEYYLQHSECRPVSPLSTLSDVEYYDFCLEELFDENRPDSPDSLTSQNEAKHTSVSATASLLFATSKPLTYADIVRGVTHMGHEDKMPTVSSFELRPFWLSSMTSDEEYNLSTIDDWVSDLRPQSPESLASQWELRSLSPDSPVPQFRTPHVDYDLDLARDRSFTPESTLSDWEGTDLYLDALFDESRPESPQSVLSDLGLGRFFSNRALSPESVSSDFDFSLLHDWLADFRASSPESVASVEQHHFFPSMAFGQMMTQHCDYYLQHSECRPVSPLSTLSDVEYYDFCLEELFDENRPDSPDSLTSQIEAKHTSVSATASLRLSNVKALAYADIVRGITHEKHTSVVPAVSAFEMKHLWPLSMTSDEEYTHSDVYDWVSELRPQSPESLASQWELRPLSPDSPVPQFRTPHVDYDLDLARDRSFTPESTFSDWEGTDFCLDTLFNESRPQSPESVSSEYELRSLSPDSPVPQFRCPRMCDDVELTKDRSCTPESTLSDWEGTDLCLDFLFDESRTESPQSVLSDLGLDRFFGNRALSPESVSSDFDFSLLHEWLADFRASSPQSVASVEQHPFSSSMAFGQMMTQHCDYYLQHSECRPVSPLSTLSDVEYHEFYLEELFDENRPDSPDSLTSQIEAKYTSVSATTSLPLTTSKPLTYADIVRGVTHMEHEDKMPIVSSFELRPFWFSSMTSDEGYSLSTIDDWVSELRPQSPESLASQWELRSLSPDSPVPHFRTPHVGYDLDLARDRSFTPESTFSDWEGTDFCLDTLFDESRPQSPESVSSEYELGSLSPDSPVPQFRCPCTCDDVELTRNRSFTPESTLSDWEGTDLCLDALFDESRPESPQSVLSDLGLDRFFSNRTLSPESVSSDFDFSLLHDWLADFRASSPESVASVEQHPFSSSMAFGQMMTQHCDYYLQHSECRPVSPLSTLSDVEYYDFCLEELFDENRPDSPDSLTSQNEAKHTSVSATASLLFATSKPLTYADIVRGVTHMGHEDQMPIVSSFELRPLWPLAVTSFELRPFWLSSMTSDEEYNLSTIDDWVSDLRPQSPESLASQWELRSLSPDSPVPHFRTPHVGYDLDLARDRSFTPESTFSDWEGTDFCLDTLFDESRPQSPESVSSEYELRSLSPDSPVPQFRCPCTCDDVELTRNRSFTPESTLSDWEGTDLCLDALFDESRPESPQSVLSDLGLDRFFSNRTLSPESVSSDFDFSLLHDWLADFRASSPESVASVEQHPFSSSMAFGQMMSQHCDYYLQRTECRPVSPLSTLSDVEYYEFCLEELFDENRPDSPDSLTSQNEAKHTSVSATASLLFATSKPLTYADIVRGVTHMGHEDQMPIVSSFELRPLWPLAVTSFELRPFWLSSMTSDEEYNLSTIDDWVSDLRPQSPESLASQWELRSLSPDSPVPQFRTPHMDYDLDLARDRSFTPESTFSDWEGTDFCLDTLFDESRPQSPESVLSQYELRSLSPDSPVPQFRHPRMWDHVELTRNRSFTPESTLSDWEGTDLCLDALFDESRPESPQSVLSDLGLDRFFSNRALSPESVSSDFDFSLLHEWLADFRASSPESVASVEQHHFSPSMAFGQMMTQHCDYYLQHSECRPVSPLSTLSDVEYYDFCLEELFDENRPDSPDSLTSQIEAKHTSVSATASLRLSDVNALTYADIVRGITHEKHTAVVPAVSAFELKHLWPLSMTSDEEYTHSNVYDWVNELRPQSPESLASQWELRSLSPDSPVPQFRTPHVDYDLDLARDRSFTPESTFSDWEGTDFCLDTLFNESRPQSPESVSSEYELRSLSPDSPVPQFRCPRMCDDVELTKDRSFTPESTLSDWEGTDLCLDALFDESRPESPQSVLSDLGLDRFFSNRALSPESVSSDFDFSLLHDWLADFRASSPESVASVEQHPFSSSMAFGQMMSQHCDYYLQRTECRPVSPLSTLSDVEYYKFCLEELFDENRPDSPDSLTSQNEAKHTSVSATASLLFATSKPLTYADIVRGVTHMGHEDQMPIVSSFELRPLWPLAVTSFELRPFWLSSMTSDEEYNLSTIDDWVSDLRPQSPESLASQWELRSLSPDSPVPQFKTPHMDYDLDLARDRSFTPESTFSDWEGIDFCLDTLFDESRPQSPESVLSQYELRSLSPDSPVPQFRHPPMWDHVELTRNRSFTPESTLSDWEGTDLCLDALFDESRPESLQSVLSDLGLDRFFSNRALSPESVSSDFDFSLLHEWLADFRASSPESVASVEQHHFSPSMAFGQMMTQHCDYYLQHSECRPVSPLSTLSDVEYYDFCLEELFDENRPDSPDSLTSQIEAKHTSLSATASLRLSDVNALTYADIVRGITHEKHTAVVPAVSAFELKHLWPLSMTSDEEYTHSNVYDWVSELRPQSPESLASQWELRSLSPDSPVPQFRTPHVDYDLDLARDRSFTPESTFSDWEGTDFCLDTLFNESRPQSPESVSSEYELRSLSPDSPVPQFRCPRMCDDVELTKDRSCTPESTLSDWEGTDLCLDFLFDESRTESPQSVLSDIGLDRFFGNRALSPESVSSDFDFSLLHEWLADFRASSPQSVASVEQHPFSSSMAFGQMMTQHCDYYLQHSECRPVSPLSTLSDVEYYDFCLEELFDENRPDSPDSLTSQIEVKHTSVSSTASLRLSDVNALTYADIVRGITHEKHTAVVPAVSAFELKHLWPLSMTSDEEYTHSDVYDWVSELRPQSPESLASQWELRSLSPDSPVPDFRSQHPSYDLDFARDRLFTPESTFSDWEGTDFCLDILFDESRPQSPESVASQYQFTSLSPDSPAPQFRLPHCLYSSGVISGTFSLVCRSDSGISRSGTVETRSTGPSQHEMQSQFNETFSPSEFCLASPEILHSDDGSPLYSTCSFTDQRPPSPESLSSLNEFTALSPDSEIPLFDCQPCYYMHLSENSSLPPDTIMPERDYSNLCHDTLLDEIRPDSPESVVFDSEFCESISNMPFDDEYTQSFLDYWMSELRPSTPQIPESIGDQDEVLNALTCGQNLPEEIVTADNRLVYKKVSRRLMAHIYDPAYDRKYVCDKVCNQNKSDDSPVSMGEPNIPPKPCQFENTTPDSKPLQDSSLSHSTVPDLTVSDLHPEMLMPPSGTMEREPRVPSLNNNDQSFFVRPPPWKAKNLD
ncbi:uncharacterized protein LOC115584134 isoform X2 [Sparus aurata]|uniref:uncharacterized protein LOC115584134 isoform X2 n=1 Tax=Sparus aurata TaxID=8175 RepID=UPI0011C0D527|nr:uncharacterized protein LOC115584134 isoform X2 [Sparus aurata]